MSITGRKNKKMKMIDIESDNGMILGSPDEEFNPTIYDFDLHKADKYIRENNLTEITDEIKKMFKK